MTRALDLALAGAGGFVLGLVYFAALWITIRRLTVSRHPALLYLGSLLLRLLLMLTGLYLIAGGDWRRLLVAFTGFLAARLLLLRRGRRSPSPRPSEVG